MLVVNAQTGALGVISQVGFGLTVTVSLQLLVHPFRAMASVTVNVQLPAPATTVTDGPVRLALVIVPQPTIDQLCVAPAVALEVYVLVLLAHTGLGPVTLQVGHGAQQMCTEQIGLLTLIGAPLLSNAQTPRLVETWPVAMNALVIA